MDVTEYQPLWYFGVIQLPSRRLAREKDSFSIFFAVSTLTGFSSLYNNTEVRQKLGQSFMVRAFAVSQL